MHFRSCVSPEGRFRYGIHKPSFQVRNLRRKDHPAVLGMTENGEPVDNRCNFPAGEVQVENDDWVYEIPNAFPFRGATYISKRFADDAAAAPGSIALAPRPEVSLEKSISSWLSQRGLPPEDLDTLLARMPEPLLLALATCSTDPADLERLAKMSGELLQDPETGRPTGMAYSQRSDRGASQPDIRRYSIFKAVANNPALPDDFKRAMVLRPGAQGGSEIVGEWCPPGRRTHVYEYMRHNSYIPWGHYAANMADDAVRYRLEALSAADMQGLRHLYYQRTYVRLAADAGIAVPDVVGPLSAIELEALRGRIHERIAGDGSDFQPFTATLWGWNFGYDYAPSGYRLHGSHQQIHQQYALVPKRPGAAGAEEIGTAPAADAYAYGDLVGDFAAAYERRHGRSFFEAYIEAIHSNCRMSGTGRGEESLVVYEDPRVMVFVPKAQTSQWELQLMPLASVGNILEADAETRKSLDRAMLVAVRILSAMGARMITSVEASKRFDRTDSDQRLIYFFLPRLPESPGAFSEAQLRWINRHYPEDIATACRQRLPAVLNAIERERS
ncbi:MAG: hypothetical protein LJE65_16420 [Desulfobacteraceae bacterium]|nr:hypothetical protein [Desulfobacteraceae bacterium]